MRVVAGQRIEFTTDYRIDVAKWDTDKQRIDIVTPKYALLGTHVGWRTFICNALFLGIPAQVVMKWTGHSDYKAMKPYIDIADDIKAVQWTNSINYNYFCQKQIKKWEI
jgi:hypothetical protein